MIMIMIIVVVVVIIIIIIIIIITTTTTTSPFLPLMIIVVVVVIIIIIIITTTTTTTTSPFLPHGPTLLACLCSSSVPARALRRRSSGSSDIRPSVSPAATQNGQRGLETLFIPAGPATLGPASAPLPHRTGNANLDPFATQNGQLEVEDSHIRGSSDIRPRVSPAARQKMSSGG
jgi:heme/copper-type cytochrome/quinol oxidase subunit 2